MTATAPTRQATGWPVLVGVAVLAGATAAAVAALSLADALTATGLPDPGPVTTFGLPAVRAIGEIAAVVAVGSFLFAAFFTPPQPGGVLDADGWRAVRAGAVASGMWAVCATLLVPLTLSDLSGRPLTALLDPAQIWSLAGLLEVAGAWRWTAVIAAVVAVAAVPVLRWAPTPLLLVGALASLLPLGLTGHSSAGGAHDIGTNSLTLHLLAAALWAGGLLALLAHTLRGGDRPYLAARRFSALAGCCFVAIAITGVLNAAIRIRPSEVFTTGYGALLLVKATAFVALGVLGWRQRRSGLAALRDGTGSRRPMVRLALTEAAIFGVTFGVAVGLGRTPPPASPSGYPSIPEVEIGYDFAGPPTVGRLLFDWRFDLILGTAALVLAACYLAGVMRLRRRGDSWPVGRTTAWLLGCATLLITSSSGIGRYMPAVFSVHMAAHMLLSMLVPILLALGGAVTLALRALRPAGRGEPPGMREWILAALHSRVSRLLTSPIVATTIFVAGFYALYFGGIFDAAVGSHAGHVAMNLHFLITGYLFYWAVIGVDPTPTPIPHVAKLAMVFASLPLHAFFGVVLMGSDTVLGEQFYRSLQLPWHTDLLGDQKLGGAIAWSAGELPLIVVMIALLIQWRRSDQRTATREDRAADRDDGAQLAAYNAMLAELGRHDAEPRR